MTIFRRRVCKFESELNANNRGTQQTVVFVGRVLQPGVEIFWLNLSELLVEYLAQALPFRSHCGGRVS